MPPAEPARNVDISAAREITDKESTPGGDFVPCRFLEMGYRPMGGASAGPIVFGPPTPVTTTRRQRLRRAVRRRWNSSRRWLAQRIYYIEEDYW